MAIPATLRVTELDFTQIKQNFKSFLSTSQEFTDFNFEGSGMSVLLDVLAYNTHYNAILANMLANEMFLDTAAKRSSVVSHAKSLGYRPRGLTSAKAHIILTITSLLLSNGKTPPDTFVIPKGTSFLATVGNSNIQFSVNESVSAVKDSSGLYTFDLTLVEGVLYSYEWLVQSTDIGIRYLIPNPNVDISTVSMQVRKSASDISHTTWNNANSILSVNSDSPVFFVQETQNGYYEIYFGNNVIGAMPEIGNLITIQYNESSGNSGNGASKFVPLGKIANLTNNNTVDTDIVANTYNINTSQSAVGGSDSESIDEIRFNASNTFITQNRAVTIDDYKNIIQASFSNIKAIKVWGGETNQPVKYGKVLVCIQPQYGDIITQTEKDFITDILRSKSVISVGLEFVDPEYINIMVNSNVLYNPNLLPASVNLQTAVAQSISNFSNTQLEKFGMSFKFSKFGAVIDDTHEAINSNTTGITIYKVLLPKIGERQSYVINFNNKISNLDGAVTSSLFKLIENDSTYVSLFNKQNKVFISHVSSNGSQTLETQIGIIDLTNGSLSLDSLWITDVIGDGISIFCKPDSTDVSGGSNNILRILPSDVKIKPVIELSN